MDYHPYTKYFNKELTMKNTGFNWSNLFEDATPEKFLQEHGLWGEGQGLDNPGRMFWIEYITKKIKDVTFYNMEQFRFLEIGFGSGADYLNMDQHNLLDDPYIHYYGADVTPEFCQLAAKNMPKAKAITLINGTELPYEDNFFSIVYMRHVLEHQSNYRWLMRECFRICSDEIFINFFLPPTANETDDIHFDNVFYHNRYSKKLFINFCNKYNFKLWDEKIFKRSNSTDNIYVLKKNK